MPMLRRFRFNTMILAATDPDNPGGGGDSPQQDRPQPRNPAPREPEMFSKEYVKELRQESASYRTRAQEAEKKAQEAEERASKAAEEADGKVKEASTAAEKRIIRAELKAEAVKAGIVDIDGLSLADLSEVKLNDKGEIEGGSEAIAKLKEAKPYLFAEPTTSSSSTRTAPKPGETKPKSATEMTPEEYAAAKRKYGIK